MHFMVDNDLDVQLRLVGCYICVNVRVLYSICTTPLDCRFFELHVLYVVCGFEGST